MSRKSGKKRRLSLTLLFSLVIFFLLLASILVAALIMFILVWTGVISSMSETFSEASNAILLMAAISLVVGSVTAIFVSRASLKPVNTLISQMNRLASGDFKARLHYGKPVNKIRAFEDVSASFNTMAAELGNIEMLRGDFVNNFSHEFKTPIVSIAGFAKLLRRECITEEQRLEYLDVIQEESMRLSYMATNVLDLSRVENQEMLTDVAQFNLSEQLRTCILLLEQKWEKKGLDFRVDFGEYTIAASEELLKQVWINLLDNAIKFAAEGSTVELNIQQAGEEISVSVLNTGPEIPPPLRERIFNKFYQADESRSTDGNGIGLAIVKRITELHHGTIRVDSENGVTTFTVTLPKKQ